MYDDLRSKDEELYIKMVRFVVLVLFGAVLVYLDGRESAGERETRREAAWHVRLGVGLCNLRVL